MHIEFRTLKIWKVNIKPKNLLILALFIMGFGVGITAALLDMKLIFLPVFSFIGLSIVIFVLSRKK
jgi:hypothetical protein